MLISDFGFTSPATFLFSSTLAGAAVQCVSSQALRLRGRGWWLLVVASSVLMLHFDVSADIYVVM